MSGKAFTNESVSVIFEGAADFFSREIICDGKRLYAYAIDGLISGSDMSRYVLQPVSSSLHGQSMEELYHNAATGTVYSAVVRKIKDQEDAAKYLVNGFCVLLFPNVGALAYEVKTPEKRGISAPEVENTVKGPKDAFVETVRTNTSLVRRHLRSPQLRLCEKIVGERTLTNVTVVWLQGVTNRTLVDRMLSRIDSIQVDGFLSPAAVQEYVSGSRPTAFPMLQYTERPDRFCQGILDGRIGLLIDGLPLGYLAPVDLGMLMESPEDRSIDYVSASCIRVLRYCALFLSLLLPGIYVAMAVFHQHMLPLPLLRSVIESKQNVPFSTAAEVLGLLIAFELLQESGIHLPQAVGQSVSIIGGIVVGSAAVEAGIISPAALIAVSISGICGFVQPNRDFAEAIRVWRFLIAAIGSVLGLFGVCAGLLILLVHLSGLRSLGVPYLTPLAQGKHIRVIRKLLKQEINRTDILEPEDRRNQR